MKADVYNYSNGTAFTVDFPMSEEKIAEIMKKGEVMVDDCPYVSLSGYSVGMTLTSFNNFVKLLKENNVSDEELKIYNAGGWTIDEIAEKIENGGFSIIDFYDETASWSSSDFNSEDDRGRVLYQYGFRFPADVPEELKDYMDYAMLWRDEEINSGIRAVMCNDSSYLVW